MGNEMEENGTERIGMEENGTEWAGMEQNRTDCNRMDQNKNGTEENGNKHNGMEYNITERNGHPIKIDNTQVYSHRGCQIGMQGPQLCAEPRHFCKLDVATSRMAFLDLNLHGLQLAT